MSFIRFPLELKSAIQNAIKILNPSIPPSFSELVDPIAGQEMVDMDYVPSAIPEEFVQDILHWINNQRELKTVTFNSLLTEDQLRAVNEFINLQGIQQVKEIEIVTDARGRGYLTQFTLF